MVFLLTVKRPMIQVQPSNGCKTIAALIRLLCDNHVNIYYIASYMSYILGCFSFPMLFSSKMSRRILEYSP